MSLNYKLSCLKHAYGLRLFSRYYVLFNTWIDVLEQEWKGERYETEGNMTEKDET